MKKNINDQVIFYWYFISRPQTDPCTPCAWYSVFLSSFELGPVVLGGFVLLVSSIPVGSYTLSTSFSIGFLETWGERFFLETSHLELNVSMSLTIWILSDYGYLFSFVSEENCSHKVWTRKWSTSLAGLEKYSQEKATSVGYWYNLRTYIYTCIIHT